MEFRNNLRESDLVRIWREFGAGFPLQRIIRFAMAAECRSVLVEPSVVEAEYSAEFAAFYTHSLATKGKASPTRLHFFSRHIGSVEDLVEKDPSYLGYCDLRPTTEKGISCALIDQRVFIPAGSQNHLFLICQKPYEVQVCGKTLAVNAFPYIQQDGSIIRCAQAALATMAMHLGVKMTGPDFTKVATKVPVGNRQIPSPGLRLEQIAHSISEMGLDPVVYDWTKAPKGFEEGQHREQIIYRYLESRIPVFVGIKTSDSYHALVVIGHSFTPDTWQAEGLHAYYQKPKTGWIARFPEYHCSTDWIERFIVQDDNMGPYTLIHTNLLQYHACEIVAAPLPEHVYLQAETAEVFAASLLSARLGDLSSKIDAVRQQFVKGGGKIHPETEFWYSECQRHIRAGDYVLRTCLRNAADWKRDCPDRDLGREHSDLLGRLDLPEKVWQIEISWPTIFTHSRCCGGEIIVDATTPIYERTDRLKQGWLYIHLPGVILHRSPSKQDAGIWILDKEDGVRRHHFTLRCGV